MRATKRTIESGESQMAEKKRAAKTIGSDRKSQWTVHSKSQRDPLYSRDCAYRVYEKQRGSAATPGSHLFVALLLMLLFDTLVAVTGGGEASSSLQKYLSRTFSIASHHSIACRDGSNK